MNVYLDIIFSTVLGSMLLLMIFAFNNDMVDTGYKNNLYYAVQKNGIDLKEILEDDLKKAGLGVGPAIPIFIIADSNEIKYKADLYVDGTIHEIHYYVGDTSTVSFTENPRDRVLCRKIDSGSPDSLYIGLISLRFNYYDENGTETSTLSDIQHIEYRYYLENATGYDGEFPGLYMRGRIKPKNIF